LISTTRFQSFEYYWSSFCINIIFSSESTQNLSSVWVAVIDSNTINSWYLTIVSLLTNAFTGLVHANKLDFREVMISWWWAVILVLFRGTVELAHRQFCEWTLRSINLFLRLFAIICREIIHFYDGVLLI
jgi:hypothetical protein